MASAAQPTPGISSASSRQDRDPLGRVIALGGGAAAFSGSILGVIGALAVHAALAVKGLTAMIEIGDFAEAARAFVAASRINEVDVDLTEPEKPPEPEPPPPEPEPDPVAKPIPEAASAPAAAPEAAQAGQALTAEPTPDDPLDFTDTIVTGPGTSYAGGTTAEKGTSTTAVKNPGAKPGGKPGGTGTSTAPNAVAAPPAKNLTRSPAPTSLSWNCGFPAEADMEQIDYATVMISVTVAPDGRAKSVSVLKDPGYGFGALARSCAFRMRYNVGLDAAGKPVTKTTPPFPVRFTR